MVRKWLNDALNVKGTESQSTSREDEQNAQLILFLTFIFIYKFQSILQVYYFAMIDLNSPSFNIVTVKAKSYTLLFIVYW